MNLVERWFSALTTKMLQRGVHRSVRDLVAAIREFLEVHNASGKRYVWVKTADRGYGTLVQQDAEKVGLAGSVSGAAASAAAVRPLSRRRGRRIR
jgi:hypothetical protein